MDGELYNLKHTLSSIIIPQTKAKISTHSVSPSSEMKMSRQ
jgi:hypothetical protein